MARPERAQGGKHDGPAVLLLQRKLEPRVFKEAVACCLAAGQPGELERLISRNLDEHHANAVQLKLTIAQVCLGMGRKKSASVWLGKIAAQPSPHQAESLVEAITVATCIGHAEHVFFSPEN